MKLKNPGKNILDVEISQISPNGIWILILNTEYFLSYENFPWFKNGTVAQIYNVRLLYGFHLQWPDLDVDLHMDSLRNIEKYPLTYVS